MRIKEITFEHICDFSAVMECEHCGSTQKNNSGYHDGFYHSQVIPAMACDTCGRNRSGVTVSKTPDAAPVAGLVGR